MNQIKSNRGRPRLNKNSETKVGTYKISEKDYQSFLAWCKSRKLKPSTVVRSLVIHHYVKDFLEELEIKNLRELKEE